MLRHFVVCLSLNKIKCFLGSFDLATHRGRNGDKVGNGNEFAMLLQYPVLIFCTRNQICHFHSRCINHTWHKPTWHKLKWPNLTFKKPICHNLISRNHICHKGLPMKKLPKVAHLPKRLLI